MHPTANIDLGLCPCGESATWYRTEAAAAAQPLKPSATTVSALSLEDVQENLCDGCYKFFTGSLDEAVPGWKRAEAVLRRQSEAGEEDQSTGADDW